MLYLVLINFVTLKMYLIQDNHFINKTNEANIRLYEKLNQYEYIRME